jgi:hypothetical protein
MEIQYSALNPWAEADPVPLMSLSPRLRDLAGKKLGLFTLTYKHASARVNSVIEKRLKDRYPSIVISRYDRNRGADFDFSKDAVGSIADPVQDQQDLARFEDWLKGVDAVIGAVGD